MGLQGIVVAVFILLGLATLVWGMFGKKRSIVVALVALVVAVAVLGRYYSLVETQSTP